MREWVTKWIVRRVRCKWSGSKKWSDRVGTEEWKKGRRERYCNSGVRDPRKLGEKIGWDGRGVEVISRCWSDIWMCPNLLKQNALLFIINQSRIEKQHYKCMPSNGDSFYIRTCKECIHWRLWVSELKNCSCLALNMYSCIYLIWLNCLKLSCQTFRILRLICQFLV